MKKVLIIFLVFLVLGAGGFFIYKTYFDKKTEEIQTVSNEIKELNSQKEKTHLSKVASTKDAYWMRMFELWWEQVESQKGKINWDSVDQEVLRLNKDDVYLVATIKPFANWDQDACHLEEKYIANTHLPMEGQANVKVGKPCDIQAYKEFLKKAVERYDGDGQDDMPGLLIPIKYWEIMNEPSMQGGVSGGMGEELKFFVGTSEEYLEILKNSYEAIKEADPEAKVVQGGMAGMMQNFVDFWEPILSAGGGNYFDIANNHTISTTDKKEDFQVIKFKKFLEKFGLENKPIFITEVQFGELAEKPTDLKSFEVLMAKSSVFALSQGADKLFYIENWLFWDQDESQKKDDKSDEMSKEDQKMGISQDLLNSSTHKVYLNLVDKINQYDKIEVIKEEYTEGENDSDGATSRIGQYKFISNSNIVYVLWGSAEIPSEISGQIKVTDIYGESKEMEATNLTLTDAPVFIEKL